LKAVILNSEEVNMLNKYGYIGSLLLTAALAAPVATMAAPIPQEASVQVRVYDKNHKDYHNWDDNENRAWGQFLSDNHRDHHEYAKSNKKEQAQYWDWRHAHPDGR
jgi:hypothetical protein